MSFQSVPTLQIGISLIILSMIIFANSQIITIYDSLYKEHKSRTGERVEEVTHRNRWVLYLMIIWVVYMTGLVNTTRYPLVGEIFKDIAYIGVFLALTSATSLAIYQLINEA